MFLDERRRVQEGVRHVEHLRRGGRGYLLDLAVVEAVDALLPLLVLELKWDFSLGMFLLKFN